MTETATFYRFVEIARVREWRERIRHACVARGLRGTVLLAAEGINATVSGESARLRAWLDWLGRQAPFAGIRPSFSLSSQQPFKRLKVRVRDELVSFDRPLTGGPRGRYVSPADWDRLIGAAGVRLLDVRNDYEVGLGRFEGAENPRTGTFREFRDYARRHLDPQRDRHIAMYCTGGIRCEKASAWMLEQGFEHVHQLDGGILAYLSARGQGGCWGGECFVFDDRVSLDARLRPCGRQMCPGCRRPLAATDLESSDYHPGVACPRCIDRLDADRRARLEERARQVRIAAERGVWHLGPEA